MRPSAAIHGLMAEFDDPNALLAAAHRARHDGYRRMDAYTPFPIEELHEALGMRHTRLPLIVLIGGLLGCLGRLTCTSACLRGSPVDRAGPLGASADHSASRTRDDG